jgi:hypothetical protein
MLLLTELEPNCTSLQVHAERDMGFRCDCWNDHVSHYYRYKSLPTARASCVAHISTPTWKFITILSFTLHQNLFHSLIPNKGKGQIHYICLGSYLTCNLYIFVKNKFVS